MSTQCNTYYNMSSSHSTSTPNTHDSEVSDSFPLPILTQDTHEVLKMLNISTFHLASLSLLDKVQWAPSGCRYVLVMKDKTKNKFCAAHLECIAEVSSEKFWLYACGGWVGDKGLLNNWTNPTPFRKLRARENLHHP